MNAHLYAHIVITLFGIGCFYYNVMRIRTDVYEMRTEYLDMGVVARLNIDKLKRRYPEGFDPDRSMHRGEGDI